MFLHADLLISSYQEFWPCEEHVSSNIMLEYLVTDKTSDGTSFVPGIERGSCMKGVQLILAATDQTLKAWLSGHYGFLLLEFQKFSCFYLCIQNKLFLLCWDLIYSTQSFLCIRTVYFLKFNCCQHFFTKRPYFFNISTLNVSQHYSIKFRYIPIFQHSIAFNCFINFLTFF